MDESQHTLWKIILSSTCTYQNGSMPHADSAGLDKQALLLTLQQVSKGMGKLISSYCRHLVSINIRKFGANTPEAWLARHGHLLAELHVGDCVAEQQQLAAIARGLHAAHASHCGVQLQVFTGHTPSGMAGVLAELQGSSQHLTRLELRPAHCSATCKRYFEEEETAAEHSCFEALKEVLPQLRQLKALTLELSNETSAVNKGTFFARRTISVAHLSHLTSLHFASAFVSSSEGLPSSLQQLRLDPIISIDPLMQLTGLEKVRLGFGVIESFERQQLLEQLAVHCIAVKEVVLEYYNFHCISDSASLERAEMSAWAKLPVCKLYLFNVDFVDQQDVQLFPKLLAATQQHLTNLQFDCINVEAVKRLPASLAQLTGLRKLDLNICIIKAPSERQQLLRQLAENCTSLTKLQLTYIRNDNGEICLEGGEMAAWASLPLCCLRLAFFKVVQQDVQRFPQLLAATHKHLTELSIVYYRGEKLFYKRLHEALAQLTGLRVLHLGVFWALDLRDVVQLCEVVAAQLRDLEVLSIEGVYVSRPAMQYLSAARSLADVSFHVCRWDDGVDDALTSRFKLATLSWAPDALP